MRGNNSYLGKEGRREVPTLLTSKILSSAIKKGGIAKLYHPF